MKRNSGKTIAITAFAIAFIALALFLVWQSGARNQNANNGTGDVQVVRGTADGFKGPINATVSVEAGGRIVDISLTGLDETPEIGGAALTTLAGEIKASGSTNEIDVVSGATYTSEGAFNAIADAMSKLKGR